MQYQFNGKQYQPKFGSAGGLPAADGYKVIIVSSEGEETADGQGGFLRLDCQVIEGPLTGQVQQIRLNLWNNSPKAVEIANSQMSAICHAVGVFMFNDTIELHGKPFIIDVRNQKKNPEYTEVYKVRDINGNEPGKSSGSPAAQPSQAQPAPAAPPPANVQPGAWPGATPAAPAPEPAPAYVAPPAPPPPPAQGGWNPNQGGQQQPAAAENLPPWKR